MMKKLTLIFTAALISLSLTACSDRPTEENLVTAMQELLDKQIGHMNEVGSLVGKKGLPTPKVSKCTLKNTTEKSEGVWKVEAVCTADTDGKIEDEHGIFTLVKRKDKYELVDLEIL